MKFGILLTIALSGVATIAAAETRFTAAEQAAIMTAHNKWRTEVSVPAMKWSTALADSAQAYANHLKTAQACKPSHSGATDLGENLFWASALTYSNGITKVQAISPAQAIESWGSEKINYNYDTNSCDENKVCGHYTQIVWKSTTELGCGKAVCADNSQVWVCNYTPAGNYIGQKPY